jgi:alpha-L-rhamnosidase
MNRKIKKGPFSVVIIKFLALFTALISNSCNAPDTENQKKPNIIYVLTDDQRWDAIGYAGNPLMHTPEMDKLALEGTYFVNSFVTTPICAASRASIITGTYERANRYTFQVNPIREEFMELSYPKVMRDHGYFTGFFGKYGIRVNEGDLDKIFDVHDDYDRNNRYDDHRGYFYKTIDGDTVHLTRYTGHQALDFIENAPEDQPFCLSLSFSAPHAHDRAPLQYFWQNEVDHLYQGVTIPGPELADDHYFNSLPLFVQEGMNRTRWFWRFDTPEKYQHSVKGYYRMITGIDNEIANIRDLLKRKGLDGNTVIILTSDNGYFLGERQLAGKWLMYEESVKVPLIIYDPRIKNQKDNDEMVLNIDVTATMLDLAGIEIPDLWQGKSLVPLVTGAANTLNRDTILLEHLWENPAIPSSEAVRTQEWKYLRYINDKSVEELYNLKEDPIEVNNLARDEKYREVLIEMRNKTDELVDRFGDPFSAMPEGLTATFDQGNVPKYNWRIPEQSRPQSAYQILVASTEENIRRNIGDIWNSGRIDSEQQEKIQHQGAKLNTGNDYYWKVRVWDKDNRLTEYCDARQFTIGRTGAGISK